MHPPRGGWIAWPLLALAALPVAITAVVARRVLSGSSTVYGELPGGLPVRERAALLLQLQPTEVHLLVSLLALGALLWLARPGARRPPPTAALWCGAALAGVIGALAVGFCALVGYLVTSDDGVPGDVGFFGPRESLLEMFGARVATALLLTALAVGVAVVLASTARRDAAPALLDEQPHEPEPPPAAAAPEPEPEPAEVADADPHARYRRPG